MTVTAGPRDRKETFENDPDFVVVEVVEEDCDGRPVDDHDSYSYDDPPEQEGPSPAEDGPDSPDPLPVVVVTHEESEVVRQVTEHLGRAEDLFVRDDKVVRPLVIEQDEMPRLGRERQQIRRPAMLMTLRPAAPAYVRNRITQRCGLVKKGRDGGFYSANPPAWLAPAVLENPGDIRRVRGVLQGPTLDVEGRLICRPGYDEATGLYLSRGLDGLRLADRPSWDDAAAAAQTLLELVKQFPFRTSSDKSRWLALVLAAACRHLIATTPLGLIVANVAGAGKSLLANVVSMVVNGLACPITMSWPDASGQPIGNEVRKKLASLLHESAGLVLADNLPRGEEFGCAELDCFLTSRSYHDRELGRNDGARVGGPNNCLLLATGNNVRPVGDTADRSLLVELLYDKPNPRDRDPDLYEVRDLEGHILGNRSRYLGAVLTVWRAWIYAGKPQTGKPHWGSFEDFAESAVAAVRWLGLPDPLDNRRRVSQDMDPEANSLTALVSAWLAVLPAEWLTAANILDRIEKMPDQPAKATLREALASLKGFRWANANSRSLGKALAGQANRCVALADGTTAKIMCEQDPHTKVNTFLVQAALRG